MITFSLLAGLGICAWACKGSDLTLFPPNLHITILMDFIVLMSWIWIEVLK